MILLQKEKTEHGQQLFYNKRYKIYPLLPLEAFIRGRRRNKKIKNQSAENCSQKLTSSALLLCQRFYITVTKKNLGNKNPRHFRDGD